MAKQERGLSGSASTGAATKGEAGKGISNRESAKFWVSHRMGPFQCHDNKGPCDPGEEDNVGYMNDIGSVIDQGFSPCLKCMK